MTTYPSFQQMPLNFLIFLFSLNCFKVFHAQSSHPEPSLKTGGQVDSLAFQMYLSLPGPRQGPMFAFSSPQETGNRESKANVFSLSTWSISFTGQLSLAPLVCVCWEAVHSCYSGSNYSTLMARSEPFASLPFQPFIFLLLWALSGQREEAECQPSTYVNLEKCLIGDMVETTG